MRAWTRFITLVAIQAVLSGCWLLADHVGTLVETPADDAGDRTVSDAQLLLDSAADGPFCRFIDAAFCEDFEGSGALTTDVSPSGCGEVRRELDGGLTGGYAVTGKRSPDAAACTATYVVDTPAVSRAFAGSYRVAFDLRLRITERQVGLSLFGVHQGVPSGARDLLQVTVNAQGHLADLRFKVGAITSAPCALSRTISLRDGAWRHVELAVERNVQATFTYWDESAPVSTTCAVPDGGYPSPTMLSLGPRYETDGTTYIDFDNIVVEAQ